MVKKRGFYENRLFIDVKKSLDNCNKSNELKRILSYVMAIYVYGEGKLIEDDLRKHFLSMDELAKTIDRNPNVSKVRQRHQ